jgi:hypothetical protein
MVSTSAKAMVDKRDDKHGWIPAHHAMGVTSGMTAYFSLIQIYPA